MARYTLADGAIADTANALDSWSAAISAGITETLYRSVKGRYYLETSRGANPAYAALVTNEYAATWLTAKGYELPEGLQKYQPASEE